MYRHVQTHTCTDTHMYRHAHVQTRTCTDTHMYRHVQTHTCTDMYRHTHMYRHVHTHTHTHTHTCTDMCRHTHTHTHMYRHVMTHTHMSDTHTHVKTCTHARTHAHTHTSYAVSLFACTIRWDTPTLNEASHNCQWMGKHQNYTNSHNGSHGTGRDAAKHGMRTPSPVLPYPICEREYCSRRFPRVLKKKMP